MINGRTSKCFIDLGSECSLITKKAANNLSLPVKPIEQPITLTTLSDSQIKPQYFCCSEVSIDGVQKLLHFYIIERSVMGVDVLIGQNFTELYDICYQKQGNKLLFFEKVDSVVSLQNDASVNVGIQEPEAVKELLALLAEYSECTAGGLAEVGITPNTEMKITLTTDKPIAHRPRQFSDFEREQIREIVDDLLKTE